MSATDDLSKLLKQCAKDMDDFAEAARRRRPYTAQWAEKQAGRYRDEAKKRGAK